MKPTEIKSNMMISFTLKALSIPRYLTNWAIAPKNKGIKISVSGEPSTNHHTMNSESASNNNLIRVTLVINFIVVRDEFIDYRS